MRLIEKFFGWLWYHYESWWVKREIRKVNRWQKRRMRDNKGTEDTFIRR